ncbi:hypothetical protein MSWHS_1665 [Methanosarcina sp. WWM596]|nr:hypothetical protein MSWHS_1665 [Methanosarcina sp. WWM596]
MKGFREYQTNDINGGNKAILYKLIKAILYKLIKAILYKLILVGDFEQRAKGLISTKKGNRSRKVRKKWGTLKASKTAESSKGK